MAEETYTRDELEGKTRLELRRICKEWGMPAEECSRMHYDLLVDWILEQQDGGGEDPKPAKKTSAKKTSVKKTTTTKKAGGGKAALAAKKGKPEPEEEEKPVTRKKKVAAKKPDPEPEPEVEEPTHDEDGVVHADMMGAVESLIEKTDELGNVVNTNFEEMSTKFEAMVEENYKLQCELYKTQGMLVHMMTWLEAAGILDPDEAPEGLGTEDKLNALAEEVEGNDEGGDDENE